MNWFERYGIVGMFFIFMTVIWLLCLSPLPVSVVATLKSNKELPKYIFGFASLSFLPIGYFIMIGSQLFYYRRGNKHHIHCEYWQNMSDEIKEKILKNEIEKGMGELSVTDQNDEVKMEAVLTYYDRKLIEKPEVFESIAKFGTKRYDVIAINNGLISAIILSLITSICLKLIILKVSIKELVDVTLFSLWFAIIIAVILLLVLSRSKNTLSRQILELGKRNRTDINVN